MNARKAFSLALPILLLSLGGIAAGAPPEDARQQALQHLLLHDCGSCHGTRLTGGLGPPLLPADVAGKTDEALVAVILNGVPGTPMPPWRPLLTEDEARWLVRRLKEGPP